MCDAAGPCEAGWAEPVPADCPLPGAESANGLTLYRLFNGSVLTAEHFWSHVRLGLPTGGATPCRACSVSLVNSLDLARRKALLPRFRGYKVAQLSLTAQSGPIHDPKASSGHVDWWPCGGFAVLAVASEVD